MTEQIPGQGHNSERFDSAAAARIRSYIERIERLNAEIAERQEDRSDIYKEAKSTGFDAKILRKIVNLRKMDGDKRREEEAIEELYRAAVGLD